MENAIIGLTRGKKGLFPGFLHCFFLRVGRGVDIGHPDIRAWYTAPDESFIVVGSSLIIAVESGQNANDKIGKA